MSGPSAGDLAIGVAGGLVVAAALADLFVTVFNYDGFSFLANRLRGLVWRIMRTLAQPVPTRAHGPRPACQRRRLRAIGASAGDAWRGA
jgi:hypothetical protein